MGKETDEQAYIGLLESLKRTRQTGNFLSAITSFETEGVKVAWRGAEGAVADLERYLQRAFEGVAHPEREIRTQGDLFEEDGVTPRSPRSPAESAANVAGFLAGGEGDEKDEGDDGGEEPAPQAAPGDGGDGEDALPASKAREPVYYYREHGFEDGVRAVLRFTGPRMLEGELAGIHIVETLAAGDKPKPFPGAVSRRDLAYESDPEVLAGYRRVLNWERSAATPPVLASGGELDARTAAPAPRATPAGQSYQNHTYPDGERAVLRLVGQKVTGVYLVVDGEDWPSLVAAPDLDFDDSESAIAAYARRLEDDSEAAPPEAAKKRGRSRKASTSIH